MNKEESKSFISNIDVQTAPVNVGDSSYEESIPDDSVDIIIGVFIDGTLNNAHNTKARQAYEKASNKPLTWKEEKYKRFIETKKKESLGSYANDLSNVAIMESHYLEFESEKILRGKVYIEGMGTTNNHLDDDDGKGLGTGRTGIPAKAGKAISEVAKKVKLLLDKSKSPKINKITIDIFGFSRGAATARHFIHLIKAPITVTFGSYVLYKYGELGKNLRKLSLDEPPNMDIRFAGLFETVASYGAIHYNDTKDLSLKAIRHAKNTFHLVAQDEHRENFVLTNINSAKSKGVEKYLPGVHSDIGGGYHNKYEENLLVLQEGISVKYYNFAFDKMSNTLRDKLIKDSWFKPTEIFINQKKLNNPENNHISPYYSVIVNRTVVSNRYSFISLHIMVEYSNKKISCFDSTKAKKDYSINEDASVELPNKSIFTTNLTTIKERLDEYIEGNREPMNFDNPEDEKMLRVIRANYIHTSAHYSDKIKLMGVWNYAPHKPRGTYLHKKRGLNDG